MAHTATYRRRRAAAGLAATAAVAVVALVVLVLTAGSPGPKTLRPGAGAGGGAADPLVYDPARRTEFEERAAAGLAHALYVRSPGGAVATAARVARFRPLVEAAARRGKVDPDTLEAIVFLESAGRPDAQASSDLSGAVGLTQILAGTATQLLGLHVDLAASRRLTRGIARGRKVQAREAVRRRVDERFDPAKALAATVRYLVFARGHLGGRDDLAVESYHMGVGNLQRALALYGKGTVPYAQLFFDTSPLHHADAYRFLASLGDDSSTYLWRVRAAMEIMRLYRADPRQLAAVAQLQTARASAEEVLRPPTEYVPYGDPFAVGQARARGELVGLPAARLARLGLAIDPGMGSLGRRLNQSARLYRALRPEALAVLETIGAGVKAIADAPRPLIVTSSVRDVPYQKLLAARDIEATHGYSLHTTGYAFDIQRAYSSRAQALAFQFMLDRLTALGIIAWVREPQAIHVTAGPRARDLLRVLRTKV